MGSLHVFLAYPLSTWEAILPKAFESFGQVTQFEWRSRGFDDTAADWLSKRDAMNAAMLDAFSVAHSKNPVDVVVGYLSGYNTSPETLLAMAERGAAIFNMSWDDKLNFPGRIIGGRYVSPAAIAHAVDLNLTNAPDSIIKYAVHGGLAMFSPEAAHPEIHRPVNTPFQYDVSFVGNAAAWRPYFIDNLQKLGVNVACFGNGWPAGPLPVEEMIKVFSQSRINLGIGFNAHARNLISIKGRDFEVPMSGGLYLTQHNIELASVYEIGKEIVTYVNPKQCAMIIRELLNDERRAASIRKAGNARARRDHTYEARWSKVFRIAGILT